MFRFGINILNEGSLSIDKQGLTIHPHLRRVYNIWLN
jgi:hypothetical protein